MKRVNTDDRKGKRLNTGKSTEDLRTEIKTLFDHEMYVDTIPLLQELLLRNDYNMHERAHYMIAFALQKTGASEESRYHHLMKCVNSTIDAETLSNGFYHLGVCAEAKKKMDDARVYFQQALDLWNNFNNNFCVGEKIFSTQNCKEDPEKARLSLMHFEEAIRLASDEDRNVEYPYITAAHYFAGKIQYHFFGQEKIAAKHFEKAIKFSFDENNKFVKQSYFLLGCIEEDNGNYRKARENYKNSLTGAQGNWMNDAYLYLSMVHLRESEASGRKAFENSMKQFGSARYEELFEDEVDYKEFNESLKIYEPQKWAEIHLILKNPTTAFTLVEQYHEMFTKWSKLMAIHQHKLKNDVPEIYKNLLAIAEKEKFILIIVNDVFTDQTILIIHDFLFRV